ncbi:MAG: Tol biopolymer transport system component [Phenylobacterium sp.]
MYTLNLNSLTEQPQLRSRQLSSSTRTDILPAISPDGRQTAFVSYQRRSMDSLQDNLPVEYLQPSLALYRPAVVEAGIYYIARQGHQLLLFLYRFDTRENVFITEVGQHEQDINVPLNISASQDGRQVVFSKVEGIETDILVQRRVVK